MKVAALLLLVTSLTIAGCGGSGGSALPLGGQRTPGYYAVDGQIFRASNPSLNFSGRVSISNDGTVRLFGLNPGGTRVTLVSGASQVNDNGTNANATLDGVASTGNLSAFVTNLVTFGGATFDLRADGATATLPTLGAGTTLTAGTYRGELVRVATDNAVTDWGTATGILTITTPGAGEPVRTLTINQVSATNGTSSVQAQLNTDGTATSTAASSARWSSNGSAFVLKLSDSATGNAGLYFVLTRQAPSN